MFSPIFFYPIDKVISIEQGKYAFSAILTDKTNQVTLLRKQDTFLYKKTLAFAFTTILIPFFRHSSKLDDKHATETKKNHSDDVEK